MIIQRKSKRNEKHYIDSAIALVIEIKIAQRTQKGISGIQQVNNMGLKINLTGEAQAFKGAEKVLLEEGTYVGTITRVSDIVKVKGWNDDELVEKVVLDVTVDSVQTETGGPVVLTLWTSTSITKGGTRAGKVFSNSKLYDVLQKAGALPKLEQMLPVLQSIAKPEEQTKAFGDFLKDVLQNRKVNVLTKNRDGKDGQQYSGIDRFLSFPGSAPAAPAAPTPAPTQ